MTPDAPRSRPTRPLWPSTASPASPPSSAVHRAFHWLHLHQPQLRLWQLEMLAIPAPPFAEHARAAWFLDRFHALGLTNVHLDEAGNALAELSPARIPSRTLRPVSSSLSAHLDTVFPAGTATIPTEDGPRILGPGACDNAAGLTALLAIAAALRYADITPPIPILFAANVGEEGEGDLRGMRHLFERGPYRAASPPPSRSKAPAPPRRHPRPRQPPLPRHHRRPRRPLLDRRRRPQPHHPPRPRHRRPRRPPRPHPHYRRTPHHLSAPARSPAAPASTPSPNPPPPCSTSAPPTPPSSTLQTAEIHTHLRRRSSPPNPHPPPSNIELIGDRPAAALPDDSPLLHTLRAVDRHLGIRTELRLGSTDANLPLSLGIPAVALAAGGTGGGIHTLAEWYDPTGRETALRRLLLTILDLAQQF